MKKVRVWCDSRTVNKLINTLKSEGIDSRWMGALEFEKIQLMYVDNIKKATALAKKHSLKMEKYESE